MGIVELIEIGLANVDELRFEVSHLEPGEVSTEAVSGLAELVFQVASNSIDMSGPGQKVRVAGTFDDETYHISVSGAGVAGSGDAIGVLNRMLERPELALRFASAARLAARHGLDVHYVPEAVGTTVRVAVPAHLVARIEDGDQAAQRPDEISPVDFVPHELDPRAGLGGDARSDSRWSDSEAFLEEVFAPLMREWQESRRPAAHSTPNGPAVAVLGVRVPGESFSLTEDGSPSTASAEAAVDLRSALSTFDDGRRLAKLAADREG